MSLVEKPRNYKKEYKKFQSSPSQIKKRTELNRINHEKGTYGNGDGKDVSHVNGGVKLEPESTNRGRKEKSRMNGSKRKMNNGGKVKYDNGGGVKDTLATLQRLGKSPEEIEQLMKNRATALKEHEATKVKPSTERYKSKSEWGKLGKHGSAERIAEYKRRGWAMDATTGGPDQKTKPKTPTKWGKQVEKPGTKPVKPTVPFTDDTLPEDADITYDEKFIPKMPGDDKFTLLSQKDQSEMSVGEQKGYLKEKQKYQARLQDKYKKEDRQEKIDKVKKKASDVIEGGKRKISGIKTKVSDKRAQNKKEREAMRQRRLKLTEEKRNKRAKLKEEKKITRKAKTEKRQFDPVTGERINTAKTAYDAKKFRESQQRKVERKGREKSISKAKFRQDNKGKDVVKENLFADVGKKIKGLFKKKMQEGGMLEGPSHAKGGIPAKVGKQPIEMEGGEYVIKKSSANKLGEDVLDYLNKTGKVPQFMAGGYTKKMYMDGGMVEGEALEMGGKVQDNRAGFTPVYEQGGRVTVSSEAGAGDVANTHTHSGYKAGE